jgi:hypothetical protein
MLAQIGGPEALRELSEQDEGLEKRLMLMAVQKRAKMATRAGAAVLPASC